MVTNAYLWCKIKFHDIIILKSYLLKLSMAKNLDNIIKTNIKEDRKRIYVSVTYKNHVQKLKTSSRIKLNWSRGTCIYQICNIYMYMIPYFRFIAPQIWRIWPEDIDTRKRYLIGMHRDKICSYTCIYFAEC